MARTKRPDKGSEMPRDSVGRRSARCDTRAVYNFSQLKGAAGVVVGDAGLAVIVTPPQQWSYAVVIPPCPGLTDAHRIRLRISANVHEGSVGFGILTKDQSSFLREVIVPHASAWQEVELITSVPSQAGPLVVRNASPSGPSRLQCRIIEAVAIDDAVATDGISLDPVGPLCDQILSAAEALCSLLREGRAITGTVPSLMEPLTGTLRELLSCMGVPEVDTRPDKISTLFANLAENTLLEVAKALVELRPLQPVPHWTFDAYERSSDLAVHLRHSLWLSAKGRGLRCEIRMPWHAGTVLALRLGNYLSRVIFSSGCYEPNEFVVIDNALQQGMVFLDGGANEGVYTVFAAARVGPTGRVIAVEPSPREVDRLKRNLAINDAHNVDIVEAALTERSGKVLLTVAEQEHAGLNTLGHFIYDGVISDRTETVEAVTLTDLLKKYKLPTLDFVKLDVEGAELRALTGAREVLRDMKPLLLLELSDAALRSQGGSQVALLDFLAEHNYNILTFDGATGTPVLFERTRGPPSHNIVAVHSQRDWGLPR